MASSHILYVLWARYMTAGNVFDSDFVQVIISEYCHLCLCVDSDVCSW